MSSITADIAIVGGGIAGLSLAAAIGDRSSVAVIEAEPQLFHHTSSRSAQQMQPTYGPAPVRALTTASIPMVTARAERAGLPVYVSRPLLWLQYDADRSHLDELLATVPGLAPIGADEAVRLLPALRRDLLLDAAIDSSAVEVDVPLLLSWYREDAVGAGVRVVPGARVTAAERIGDVWRLQAGDATIEAATVVDAAGAWVDTVAALMGVRQRGLTPKRRTVAVAPASRPVDPAWPMAADVADRFYFRPRGATILASALEDEVSEPEDAQPREEVVRTILDRVDAATDLALGAPVQTWTGLRTLSADALPVVGFDADVPGFYWLAGQGGYGIQTSAALGRVVAADLLGVPHGIAGLDDLLPQLSPARF
ncbi:NAD(P)/FAD-dependent oxidoreductase [uncultured Amnibacterium sp.]|uniref:NAD(P)/FAD-dependent oxidoreductase n=1 Tax=uncultured Amnibacterium sp. TaxID=1631851 RepID=UPI0035CB19D1